MNTILVLAILFLAAVLFVVSYIIVKKKKRRRVNGVKLLQALRMLVKHVQIHRGLMAAYLVGNRSLNDSISYNTAHVCDDIRDISELDTEFVKNADWLGVTQHWARLSANGKCLGIYQNYDQHCKLVASSLVLMNWVACHYNLVIGYGKNEKIYWYELLALGEELGQLRALGVTCLVSTKEEGLRRLCLEHISACLKEIETLFSNKLLREKLGGINSEEINTFIALVEHYIVANKSWITSEQYFSRATETIEIIYKAFDEEMQKLLYLC